MNHAGPAPGTLCIRADADGRMGIGHVMRCLALAQAWQDRGGATCFIHAGLTPPLLERLAKEGHGTHVIQAKPGSSQDSHQTSSAVHEHGSSWLVLDGYHFGREYMLAIQQQGLRLLVLDDVADRCLGGIEAVLNQNAYATEAIYQNCVPRPRLLLGAACTMLRREFILQRSEKDIRRNATRILITLGGADALNHTQLVMKAARLIDDVKLELLLIVGSANQNLPSLQEESKLLEQHHTVHLQINPPNIAELMNWCDIAVTAAGSSCWELCCLGVPLLMVVTADNQRLMPAYFARHGIADVFGELDESHVAELSLRIRALLHDFDKRRSLSQTAGQVIDGRGAARVADFLIQQP